INLYFNDIDSKNIATLTAYLATFELPACIEIHVSNLPFVDSLPQRLPLMQSAANLVFLDQYGVKDVTPDVFLPIANLKKTDLLFFFSSWHAIRFQSHDNFRQYHQLPKEAAQTSFN